jgi:hypothetical protein
MSNILTLAITAMGGLLIAAGGGHLHPTTKNDQAPAPQLAQVEAHSADAPRVTANSASGPAAAPRKTIGRALTLLMMTPPTRWARRLMRATERWLSIPEQWQEPFLQFIHRFAEAA